MPIRFPQPPASVEKALKARRGRRLRLPLRRLGAAGGAEPPLPAQPVFTAGLDELLEAGGGGAPSVTRAPSWRYSHYEPDGRAQVVELPGEPRKAVAVGDDRFSPMIREALAVASQDDRVGAADYEARLLRVPALSLLALWLHAA